MSIYLTRRVEDNQGAVNDDIQSLLHQFLYSNEVEENILFERNRTSKILAIELNADNWNFLRLTRYNVSKKIRFVSNDAITPGMINVQSNEELYTTFTIPKRSGGARTIEAPVDSLKIRQKLFADFLINELKILGHNAGHAYTKGRSIKTNAYVHKNSRFFLNLDLSNFFPSIGYPEIMQVLPMVYEFSTLEPLYLTGLAALALKYSDGIKNGYLPQGTPLSPVLSNLICVPLDYEINKKLKEYFDSREDSKAFIHYTRYSDDLTFSSTHKFDMNEVINIVNQVIDEVGYRFTINEEKTKFTTNKGKNRITGLKVNADNKVTIGYREKEALKRDIYKALNNIINNVAFDSDVIVGHLAYMKQIEEGYYDFLCEKYKCNLIRSISRRKIQ